MKRRSRIGLPLTLGLLVILFVGGAATAGGDPLVGTWHTRDAGTSNMFFFVDSPVGGVYPILFYDDHTGDIVEGCVPYGRMLSSGFAEKTVADANKLKGSFGNSWCPDIAAGSKEYDHGIAPFTLIYDPDRDALFFGLFDSPDLNCADTRQPHIKTVEKAIQELAKGKYPPSGLDVNIGCDG